MRAGRDVTGGWLLQSSVRASVIAVALASPASGTPRTPPAALPCTADGAESVTVQAIDEDFDLVTTDGRVIRLAGLDPVRATPLHPARPSEARARLTAWLVGQPASIRALAATPDRWGRVPALVFAPVAGDGGGAPLSVGLALIDAGLARFRPEPEAAACDAAALTEEQGARMAGLGLWDDPYYALRHGDDGLPWGDAAGGMVVVEGQVRHVGETRTQLYLDLGATRGSLAVRMPRRDAFMLDQGGGGHNAWLGRRLRVRGVLSQSGGPLLDVRDAGQIEIVEGPAPGVARP